MRRQRSQDADERQSDIKRGGQTYDRNQDRDQRHQHPSQGMHPGICDFERTLAPSDQSRGHENQTDRETPKKALPPGRCARTRSKDQMAPQSFVGAPQDGARIRASLTPALTTTQNVSNRLSSSPLRRGHDINMGIGTAIFTSNSDDRRTRTP